MQRTPVDPDERAGASARSRGESFVSNPHLLDPVDAATDEQRESRHLRADAWSAGWLRQDEQYDIEIAALMRLLLEVPPKP